MTIFVNQGRGGNSSPIGPVAGLIMLTLLFVFIYFVAKGLFSILNFVAPVLFIITLIMDYRVVIDYAKMLWNTLKRSPLYGLLLVFLTIVGYPVVTGYLFFKAYVNRTVKGRMEDEEERRYVEYEEVDLEEEYDDYLELPTIEEPIEPERRSDYDNMFEK